MPSRLGACRQYPDVGSVESLDLVEEDARRTSRPQRCDGRRTTERGRLHRGARARPGTSGPVARSNGRSRLRAAMRRVASRSRSAAARLVRSAIGSDERRGRGNALLRTTIDRRERGAQGLVSRDQVVERTLERLDAQRSAKPNGAPLVVDGAAGIELVEEPQPFLRRTKAGPRRARQRRSRPWAATCAVPWVAARERSANPATVGSSNTMIDSNERPRALLQTIHQHRWPAASCHRARRSRRTRRPDRGRSASAHRSARVPSICVRGATYGGRVPHAGAPCHGRSFGEDLVGRTRRSWRSPRTALVSKRNASGGCDRRSVPCRRRRPAAPALPRTGGIVGHARRVDRRRARRRWAAPVRPSLGR